MIPNVLAARYASPELVAVWSPEEKVRAERRLWLAVLSAQRDLGVPVPDGVIEAYEAVVDQVDLASIAARERVTRHDVKARIEEFAALAGHEHIHKGMTSRDLTENVEQLQIRASLRADPRPDGRRAGPAGRPGRWSTTAWSWSGRSHNVPAQATTLGKRFATRRRGAAHRVRPDRRPDRALSAARHQGSGRHRRRPARPARRRRRARSPSWSGAVAGHLGLRPGARQRRPGLPALARLRRACPRWPRPRPRRRRWPRRSG